jgi:hypothetical protein
MASCLGRVIGRDLGGTLGNQASRVFGAVSDHEGEHRHQRPIRHPHQLRTPGIN